MSDIKKKIKIRHWKKSDIPSLVELHAAVYPDYGEDLYESRHFELQLKKFKEGQFLAEIEGKIIGYACAIIVQLDEDSAVYTYTEITGSGTFSTHNPLGDTLYGADIAVHPDFRGLGVAALLYKKRKELMTRNNLRRMVAHGRIPGYAKMAAKYSAEEYVNKVMAGEITDPALRAHLKAGYKVRNVLMDHMADSSSVDYCTWLEMTNEKFSQAKKNIETASVRRVHRRIRACAAQYEFRKITNWSDFEDSIEFFMDSAFSYHSHVLVFPELFTAQLFSTFDPSLSDLDVINKLSEFTEKYVELMSSKAIEHNLFVVGGSQPTSRDGRLYNTSYLFTPNGKYYTQDKLHITPDERRYFNFEPGDSIKVFDAPFGRFGILVGYDILFPEVTRLMVTRGAEMLFCPFSADERKAYNRIRFCAHARAIENYVYIVLAGNVGNLHNVQSYLLSYGQSAILTPSDMAFPSGAVEAEADPNAETLVCADLDLSTLISQREFGSVRPFYNRRADLYELNSCEKIEIIKIH